MSAEAVASIADAAVRGLIEKGRERGSFDAKLALAEAPPEIRDAVAHAPMSDMSSPSTTTRSSKKLLVGDRLFAGACRADLGVLEDERQAASQRGDLERVNQLNLKIRNIRSRKSTRIQGETSR